MVAYDLIWQAKVSGIPYFAFDLAYDCQHVFDVQCNSCHTKVPRIVIPCFKNGPEGEENVPKKNKKQPDYSMKCNKCQSVNTIKFLSDSWPLNYDNDLEYPGATYDLYEKVIQIDCVGLQPLTYHVGLSGPYVFIDEYSNFVAIKWCDATRGRTNIEPIWEFYDIHPAKQYPISIIEFAVKFIPSA